MQLPRCCAKALGRVPPACAYAFWHVLRKELRPLCAAEVHCITATCLACGRHRRRNASKNENAKAQRLVAAQIIVHPLHAPCITSWDFHITCAWNPQPACVPFCFLLRKFVLNCLRAVALILLLWGDSGRVRNSPAVATTTSRPLLARAFVYTLVPVLVPVSAPRRHSKKRHGSK